MDPEPFWPFNCNIVLRIGKNLIQAERRQLCLIAGPIQIDMMKKTIGIRVFITSHNDKSRREQASVGKPESPCKPLHEGGFSAPQISVKI